MKYVDNYETTARALAEFVKEHAPKGMRDGDLERVDRLGRHDYFNAEFRRVAPGQRTDRMPHLEASFGVRLDYAGRDEDEEGNLWSEFRVNAQVSWASWGSTEPVLALQRLALMQEIAVFALSINSAFREPVRRMETTKVQRDEADAQNKRNLDKMAVSRAVAANCKGMRAGETRDLPPVDVASGPYDIELNGRTYQVHVGDGAVVLRRVT